MSAPSARRVLVVEPSETGRDAVRRLFGASETQPVEVVFSDDFTQAEHLTRRAHFDMVLSVVERDPCEPTREPEIDFISLDSQRGQRYEEAAKRAEFERRLLAIVGHDLRTPLSAVVTAGQLLEQRYPDEPLLARLNRSARRMDELIDDIMARSEMLVVSGDRREQEVDVASLLHDAVVELQTAFRGRTISAVGMGPLPATINGSRLTQAVINLVRNAVQYGAQDRPVTVHFAAVGEHISIAVRNEGQPIPADAIPKLFDPFHRGERANGRGAGLGLFIVKELVADLRGTISVHSDDEATTFTLVVPRSPG